MSIRYAFHPELNIVFFVCKGLTSDRDFSISASLAFSGKRINYLQED